MIDYGEQLLADFRAALLEVSGRANAAALAASVEDLCARWERDYPARLAAWAAAELRKVDNPGRSVDDALAILEQIPERRPGQILPPFPVVKQPPYLLTAEKLRELWADDQVDKGKVKLRELVATQDWLGKDDLRRILTDDANWSPETLNIEGSPNDRPYVVECGDVCYIYDGHHRLAAKHLLAVGRTKAYCLTLEKV